MDRLSLLSTPGADGSDGKRRRRSWFDAEPVSFEIAVEKNTEISPVAPSDEVLELTHFTKAPRVDFGKVSLAQSIYCLGNFTSGRSVRLCPYPSSCMKLGQNTVRVSRACPNI